MTKSSNNIEKALLPNLVDPEHEYVYKSGFYGIYDFWYIDNFSNYWKYTNAPEDHEDYNPMLGVAIKASDQPMPETNPQFFTAEGKKRHMGVPPDVLPEENENYDPLDPANVWFEIYEREGDKRYIYLDSDVRENIDLWIQYQMRVTDSNIPKLRSFAVEKFESEHTKDRVVGAIIMLMDQGLFELEPLLEATVKDCEFIDKSVKLLGRKFICDPKFFDFMTSLVGTREPEAPLFLVESYRGEGRMGLKHMASIFNYLKVSPPFLLAWHASQMFSRIVNRLSYENTELIDMEAEAFSELRRAFGTQKDLQHLVDIRLREHLLQNYEEFVGKAIIPITDSDSYGVLTIFADLMGRKRDELEFSIWLHAQPMHEITPEEQDEIDETVAEQVDSVLEGDEGEEEAEGEEPEESEVADQEAGAVDTDETGEAGMTDAEGAVGTVDTERKA